MGSSSIRSVRRLLGASARQEQLLSPEEALGLLVERQLRRDRDRWAAAGREANRVRLVIRDADPRRACDLERRRRVRVGFADARTLVLGGRLLAHHLVPLTFVLQ